LQIFALLEKRIEAPRRMPNRIHPYLKALSDSVGLPQTLMLTSKGVAGVPRAALVILAGTLSTFHLPMEGVAVLLGIDALMDMARTSVNVVGNCLASAVVARWEGVEFGDRAAP